MRIRCPFNFYIDRFRLANPNATRYNFCQSRLTICVFLVLRAVTILRYRHNSNKTLLISVSRRNLAVVETGDVNATKGMCKTQ